MMYPIEGDGAGESPNEATGEERETGNAEWSCPVVGVGASAGGLESFTQFLHVLPAGTGMAFVFIQHLDPTRESLMADLLARHTAMPVIEVVERMTLEPDHVYIIPPNKYLAIDIDELRLDEPVKDRGMRMAIDYFFRSLAEARGHGAAGVVLSGTGTDGTLGLREIKAVGGLTIAQSPATALYGGMPRSAVSSGNVDFVLPIERMAETILRYREQIRFLAPGSPEPSLEETSPEEFDSILRLLQAYTDHDFRSYKTGTLGRRIRRRMGLRSIQDAGEYLRVLRQEPEELQTLFKDLLIGVTRFFRDEEAWSVLEHEVIVPLVQAKPPTESTVRLWVPGCATGEEAYSLAILLYEQLEKQKKSLDIQGFATDLDASSIEFARTGRYLANIADSVDARRLKRFFHQEGDTVRVNKRLRESIVFAVQNLIADPPFSNLDLISCRNLLIYLDAEIQARVLETFYFALRQGGYLFLGSSESLGQQAELFEPISKHWRIYRKVETELRGPVDFPRARRNALRRAEAAIPGRVRRGLGEVVETAQRALLDTFAPASVFVDRRGKVVYQHGNLRDFFDFPSGVPPDDLATLALPGLGTMLRGLVQQIFQVEPGQEKGAFKALAPRVRRGDETISVRAIGRRVEPVGRGETLALISFEEEDIEPNAVVSRSSDRKEPGFEERSLVEQLEYELEVTREDLQSTLRELETTIEEFHASQEESMSVNEELQSTNEELETSREELQSLNEELITVNRQLEEKMRELEGTNDDLSNLLASTAIATLFLGTDLQIRRFTPAAGELLHLIAGDLGRPISDLAPRIEDSALQDDVRRVLKNLTTVDAEVKDEEDRWFSRRIRAYRTSENKIEGVVITYAEITELKQANERLALRERQQAAVARLGRLALAGTRFGELLDEAVRLTAECLEMEMCKVLELLPGGNDLLLRAGVGWSEGIVGTAKVPAGIDSQAGYTLQSSKSVVVEDMSREKRFFGPNLLLDHEVMSGISTIIGSLDEPWGVLGAHSRSTREITVDDVNFLEAVANILGELIGRPLDAS